MDRAYQASYSNNNRAGSESLILATREKDGPAHNVFVKLHDHSRASKQPASKHHSLLQLTLVEGGLISASLQDLHSDQTRFTILTDLTGLSIQVNNSNPSPIGSSSILHFCPLVPRLPQEDQYEEYAAFKFSFHCGLLTQLKTWKIGSLEPSQRSWSPEGSRMLTRQI